MDHALLVKVRRRVEELFDLEGLAAGSEFKKEPGARRLANLVNKGRVFEELIVTAKVIECVRHVLGPTLKLSSLNVRSAEPDGHGRQPLHSDSAAVPDDSGYWVCNSLWMLDDFTPDNGAPRVVPGSHRWRRLPPLDMYEPHPLEVQVTGKAGTVVIMNAHMWHGGTDNHTSMPRRAMHIYYTRGDKPQQQYQKKLLSAEVQAQLTPAARSILALDDLLNDDVSAMGAGVSGFLK
jgi:ectoine hydroxylase-related dioxygenase (phytanoyl-CoA dioxygenase family)